MTFNQIWDVLAEERAEGYEEGWEEGYEEGMEKGMEKGAREVIASLIRHLPEDNDETIANLSSKSAELVAQVRREMNAPDA
jgi:flagellar biosynthesis/type III secretory pathway protein FliH